MKQSDCIAEYVSFHIDFPISREKLNHHSTEEATRVHLSDNKNTRGTVGDSTDRALPRVSSLSRLGRRAGMKYLSSSTLAAINKD